jgi:hypothetical protein
MGDAAEETTGLLLHRARSALDLPQRLVDELRLHVTLSVLVTMPSIRSPPKGSTSMICGTA